MQSAEFFVSFTIHAAISHLPVLHVSTITFPSPTRHPRFLRRQRMTISALLLDSSHLTVYA